MENPEFRNNSEKKLSHQYFCKEYRENWHDKINNGDNREAYPVVKFNTSLHCCSCVH